MTPKLTCKLSPISIGLASVLCAGQLQAAETQSLDKIIVSANNTDQSAHSVTADYDVITRQEIEEKQYKTLAQALKTVPGVTVKSNGGYGTTTSIFMRGQSNNATLIMVDGIEMTNPMGTGGAIISSLLLGDVERIEIIKGPQSGVWGANASAGVINIVTRKAQNVAQFSLEGGTYNTQRLNTVLGASSDKADFLFTLSDLSTDGFSAVRPYHHSNDGLEDDAFQQTDVSMKIGLKPVTGHRLEAFLKNTSSSSQYDSSTNPDAGGPFYESDYSNTIKKLSYQYEQNDLNASIYWLENEIDQYNDGQLTEYGAKGHYEYAANQRLAASLTSKEFEGTNSSSGDTSRYYNTDVALNNTNQFNGNRLIITEALRYDEFSKFDNKVTGKVGIKNYFTADIYASANVGTAYNAPTLYQVTYGATHDLQPEETEAYDITLGVYGLEVTYYQTETKNLINYGGTWPNDYYENLSGKSKFSGVEASYQTDITAIHTDLKLGYTYQSAKNDDDQWLSHRPEQQASLQIDNYSLAGLHLGWETRYIGTMYDKVDKQGAQIGEYFVTDLTADYALNSHFTLYGKVLNLFNDDYTSAVASYESDGTTPAYVYGNGGTQVSFGLRGTF